MRKVIAATVLAACFLAGSSYVAEASPAPVHHDTRQTAWVEDEDGILVTPCALYDGEVLTQYGTGDGVKAFTVVSVTEHGALDLVALSPQPALPAGQASGTIDFVTSVRFG